MPEQVMITREGAKEILSRPFNMKNVPQDILEAHRMAIKALEQESILDKLDVIITDALDISIDQKESQTLRWVLDMISEVRI